MSDTDTPQHEQEHVFQATLTTEPQSSLSQTETTFRIQTSGALKPTFDPKEGILRFRDRHGQGASISRISRSVKFEPRWSPFDRLNPLGASNAFRGFHSLFWLLLAINIIRTLYAHYLEQGQFIGLTFGRLIGADGLVLALSDGVLVGCTLFCVPFARTLQKGWIRYRWTGLVIQHLGQATYLAAAIRWTFFRHWYWVQSGYLTLHSLTMLMKMHSYTSFNGFLSETMLSYEGLRRQLNQLLADRDGGWDAAIQEALPFAYEPAAGDATEPGSALASTDPIPYISTQASPPASPGLRRRRRSSTKTSPSSPRPDRPTASHPESLQILCFHPDAAIANIANDAADAQDQLSSKSGGTQWPDNITVLNFLDYLLIPSLVYRMDYPRTESIRPMYVLEKVLATFGTFSLLYIITEHYILPITQAQGTTFWGMALDLAAPFMVQYLLIFYIIFECSALVFWVPDAFDQALHSCAWPAWVKPLGLTGAQCNAFAELSRFSDRQFYEDWWNSTSFDEVSGSDGLMNVQSFPANGTSVRAFFWDMAASDLLFQRSTFLSVLSTGSLERVLYSWQLLTHVYASTMSTYKLSKFQAAFATFLLSACLHELVMAVVTKKIRAYLFLMQMAQLPMIVVGRARFFRQHPALGNLFFWIGLMSGFPLLAVGYLRF